jgi:hypothetical protein
MKNCDVAEDFSNNPIRVERNGKYGFIDENGKEIIPPRYDKAFEFSDGFACVGNNGKYGLINKFGTEVVPLKHSDSAAMIAYADYMNEWEIEDKNRVKNMREKLDTKQVMPLFRSDPTFWSGHTLWHQKTETIFFVLQLKGEDESQAIKISGCRYGKDTGQVNPNVVHRDGKDYLVGEDNFFFPVEELQVLDVVKAYEILAADPVKTDVEINIHYAKSV